LLFNFFIPEQESMKRDLLFTIYHFPFSTSHFPLRREHFFFILLIVFGVVLRLVPHPANVSPLSALALFGGVYLPRRYSIFLPLVALFISDMVLGFYATMGFVYGSFVLISLLGWWLKKHTTIPFLVMGSLLSSVLFFVITNFGVWLVGDMYTKTWEGLLNCYVLAIPFFRNTVGGDLFFVGLLFGGYGLLLQGGYKASKLLSRSL
jgi:hypothetical protein